MSRTFIGFALVAALSCTAPAQSTRPDQTKQVAQTIYFDGNILTGEALQTPHPERKTALAIRDGVIAATGSDAEVLRAWKGRDTQLIDLHHAFAMPGINDAHVHMAAAGEEKLSVELNGVRSLAEMLNRIQHAAKAAPAGGWLTGGGWDHTLWSSRTLPTRADLDRITGNHPAIFDRVDGHIAVANSAALKAAGMSRDTPDPSGGKLDRDAHGELTGIVRETAVEQVESKIPPPTMQQRKRALSLALNDAVCHGLTSVQDYSDWGDFLALESLERENRLPIRVGEWLTFNNDVAMLQRQRAAHPATDRMLHTAMLKGFMDGSLGSRTAAMFGPYSDDPGNSGIPRYTQAELNQMTVARARAGFQIGFHAIGDRANSMALDAFGAAEAFVPHAKDLRFRIEHAQVVSAGDFEDFRQLGVIASMQPSHLLSDMRWAAARLGPKRVPYSYAWKSFLDHHVPLAFGTDYPVEPITPFRGIYAAVTRMNEAGTRTYYPSERLTIGQALYAYTQGSAYAEFSETWKGKLAPGYVADFIVLDRDLTKIPPHQILSARVRKTVVAGRPATCDTSANAPASSK